VRPIGYALMAIIFLFSLGSGAWTAWKRDVRVVKASQPEFLALICVGTLIMGSSIVPLGIDDSVASQRGCDIACMATPWLIAIGFSICFASLFSKIWRLNQLMKAAASFRRIQVTIRDVLLPFAIMITLNVVFLSVWTAVDPLYMYWERVDEGRNESGDLVSYGHCTASGTVSIVMISLLAAVNLVALLLANLQAYHARKLTVAYNESKFVALSMASILQATVIGVPLLFLSMTNPTASYVVRIILIFVVCMSILCWIFVPKMIKAGQPLDPSRHRFSTQFTLGEGRNSVQVGTSVGGGGRGSIYSMSGNDSSNNIPRSSLMVPQPSAKDEDGSNDEDRFVEREQPKLMQVAPPAG